jgi:hypothetical protein
MDKAWDIQKEKHLNKNNIIFKDKKYYMLYKRLKQVDDKIKQKTKERTNHGD